MSEKQARELIEAVEFLYGPIWPWADKAKQALSELPDVVVLGRKLSEMQVIYEGKLANSKKGTYGLEEVAGRSYDKGVLDTVIGIGQLVEAVFHVRLTADGWEWVD